jgi:carbonic anhydrase/acetyltransferase-like protein (isoleucine patch superfamily)
VTENQELRDGTMILGSPAKVVRELSPEQAARMGMGALGYVRNWQHFKAGLSEV